MKSIYVFLLLLVSGFATADFLFENEDDEYDDIPEFAARLFNTKNPTGKEQASVALVRAIDNNENCTATLISKRVLISGAKFFTLYKNTRLQAYFPSHNIFLPLAFNVKEIYLHPNFTSSEKYHDIALIVMELRPENDLIYNFIEPIPLLATNDILNQGFQFMEVLGFGITNHKNSLSNGILRSKTIGVDTNNVDLSASILVFRDVDLSLGDAGAPLIMNGKLVGVATYTDTFKEGFPSIFTGIANHYDWIERVLNKIRDETLLMYLEAGK